MVRSSVPGAFATTTLWLLRVGAVSTEGDEAGLSDPVAECTPYGYGPVTAALPTFPAIWEPIQQIFQNDTVAFNKFVSINSSIPNIAPKGTLGVPDLSLLTTYSPTDTDCWWTFQQCVTPKLSGLKSDIADVPEPRTLGYGFDDGPNCSHNAFYDYLTQQNQKATMFFIGSNVMDWPLQAQRAVSDGHEICAHTWSHRYMTAFTNEQAFGELWYSMQAIKLVTGYTPTCWRPPLGDVDDRIRYIASQLGLDTILWKYNSNDWEVGQNNVTTDSVQQNYDNLISAAKSGTFDSVGAIILTHELNNYTMQTAIENYRALSEAFDYMVPIAVAQNRTQPYVETNFTMPSFASYIASRPPNSSAADQGSSSSPGSAGGQSSSPGNSGGVALGLTSTHALSMVLVLLSVALCL